MCKITCEVLENLVTNFKAIKAMQIFDFKNTVKFSYNATVSLCLCVLILISGETDISLKSCIQSSPHLSLYPINPPSWSPAYAWKRGFVAH